MKFLKLIKRKSFLGQALYVGLNVALAIVVFVIVRTIQSPVPALVLVVLSKWRVFAVRPRFWLANIKANLVDFIFSISVVILMYSAAGASPYSLMIQIGLTIIYICWLVWLKPLSSKRAVVLQSAFSLFASVTALFVVSYNWWSVWVVLGMALIGYVTAHHTLSLYKKETQIQLLSLVWAFLMAQLGWIFYHWVITYKIPFLDLPLPQVSIVVCLISFLAYKIYDSLSKHQKVRSADVLLPAIFTLGLVLIILVFFNDVPIDSL